MKRVLSVASEAVPLVKTGGLADVVGALPAALAGCGWQMRLMIPAYRGVLDRIGRGDAVRHLTVQQERMGADLVVLGQERRSWLMEMVRGSVPRKQNGGNCYGSIQGLLYRFPLSRGHQPAGQAAPRVHRRRDQGY